MQNEYKASRSKVLENVIVAQLVKNLPAYYRNVFSSLFSQKPVAGPCPESDDTLQLQNPF
jgi:hypothetical protein